MKENPSRLFFLLILIIGCVGYPGATRLAKGWIIGEIVADKDYVFGATLSGIQRVNHQGKGAITLVAYSSEKFEERQYPPGRIALDRDHVYWTQEHSPVGQDAVRKVSKTGGNADSCFRVTQPEFENPIGLAVDQENVYVLTFGPTSSSSIDMILDPLSSNYKGGALIKIPKSGGLPTVLVSGIHAPVDLQMDGASLYWSECGSYREQYSPLMDYVYQFDGAIRRIAKTGGSPVTVASKLDGPSEIHVDETELFWVSRGHYEHNTWTTGRGIFSSLHPDSPMVLSNASPWSLSPHFAIDSHYVYFQRIEFYGTPGLYGRKSHKYILRTPRQGGAQELVYKSDHDILSLFSFADDLFWMEGVQGDVMKKAKL